MLVADNLIIQKLNYLKVYIE